LKTNSQTLGIKMDKKYLAEYIMPGGPLDGIFTALSDIVKTTEIAFRDIVGSVWSAVLVTIVNLLPGDYSRLLDQLRASELRRIQNLRSEYMRVLADSNKALLSGDGAMFLMAINPGYYAIEWMARRTYDRNPLIGFADSDMGKLYAGITSKFDQDLATKTKSSDDMKKQLLGKKGMGGLVEALRELFFGSGELDKVMAKKKGGDQIRRESIVKSIGSVPLNEKKVRFNNEEEFLQYIETEMGVSNINDMVKYLGVNQSTAIDGAKILKGRINEINKLVDQFTPGVEKIKKLLTDDNIEVWIDELGADHEVIKEINKKSEKVFENSELLNKIIDLGEIKYTGEDDMKAKVKDQVTKAIFASTIVEARKKMTEEMEKLQKQFLETLWADMPRPADGLKSNVWLYGIDDENGSVVEVRISESDLKNISPLSSNWVEYSKGVVAKLFG
jgi:hypothetical protein